MADQTKSNPAFLIIAVVTFIVAAFFIGNIVAYVPSSHNLSKGLPISYPPPDLSLRVPEDD